MAKNPGCLYRERLFVFGNLSGNTLFLHLLDTLSVRFQFESKVIVASSFIILTLHIEDRLLLSLQTIIAARLQLLHGIIVFSGIGPRNDLCCTFFPVPIFRCGIDHKFSIQNSIVILIFLLKSEGCRLILHL